MKKFNKKMILYTWSPTEEEKDDVTPDEYIIIDSPPPTIGGVVIYARYGDDYKQSPFQNRHLIKHLINELQQ